MEKALRRQLGADAVDLDTRAGRAHYTLAEPVRIDFAAIEKAAVGAGYTLKELTLELEGDVVRAPCESCAQDATMLRVSETTQQIELVGDVPPGGAVRVKGSVAGWAGSHVRLLVSDWHPGG